MSLTFSYIYELIFYNKGVNRIMAVSKVAQLDLDNRFERQIEVGVGSGTAPLKVASTTVVPNFNADLLDGKHASSFALASHGTHVSYGSSTSGMTWGSTLHHGSSSTLARSDHRHSLPALPNGTTGAKGIVQLTTSTTSTSTALAATASAVKAAMDRANQAFQSASDGKTHIVNAIKAKGVSASTSDSFSTLASKIGQLGPAGFAEPVVFTSTGTWTVPAGVTTVYVTMCGGGTGGNGGNGSHTFAGAGSKFFINKPVAVTPGERINVTVGAGGGGGNGDGSAPTRGTASVFKGLNSDNGDKTPKDNTSYNTYDGWGGERGGCGRYHEGPGDGGGMGSLGGGGGEGGEGDPKGRDFPGFPGGAGINHAKPNHSFGSGESGSDGDYYDGGRGGAGAFGAGGGKGGRGDVSNGGSHGRGGSGGKGIVIIIY